MTSKLNYDTKPGLQCKRMIFVMSLSGPKPYYAEGGKGGGRLVMQFEHRIEGRVRSLSEVVVAMPFYRSELFSAEAKCLRVKRTM